MGKMVWTLTQGPAKLTPFKIFSVLHFRAGSASPSVERPVFFIISSCDPLAILRALRNTQ